MLKQCSPSVWSDGGYTSGRSKTKTKACTGLWLRPVGVHRTRLVVIPGVLNLTGIDRTLGGNVRSLPPERPVSRKRVGFSLLSCFPFQSRSGSSFNRRATRAPDLTHLRTDIARVCDLAAAAATPTQCSMLPSATAPSTLAPAASPRHRAAQLHAVAQLRPPAPEQPEPSPSSSTTTVP